MRTGGRNQRNKIVKEYNRGLTRNRGFVTRVIRSEKAKGMRVRIHNQRKKWLEEANLREKEFE